MRQDSRAARGIAPGTISCSVLRAAMEETSQGVPVRDVRAPSWSHADPPEGSLHCCLPLTLVHPKEAGLHGAATAVRHE